MFSKLLSILIPWEKQFLFLKWWYLTMVCKIVISDKIIPYWLKLVCEFIPNPWETKREEHQNSVSHHETLIFLERSQRFKKMYDAWNISWILPHLYNILPHSHTNTHLLWLILYVFILWKNIIWWWPPRTEFFHNTLESIGINGRYIGEGALDEN